MTREDVKVEMDRYIRGRLNMKYLTEDNKTLVGQTLNYINNLPEGTELKSTIDMYKLEYYKKAKQSNSPNELEIADELMQIQNTQELKLTNNDGPKLALVKKEESYPLASKAAFINVAILLYGMLNIGFIIAIAILR